MAESTETVAKRNLLVFPKSMIMIMINWVSKGKDINLSTKELQPSYTNTKHQE
jgi:hypothetical protein